MADRPLRPLLRPVLPEDERLGRAFRRLSEEHIATRRRDAADEIWQRVVAPRMIAAGWRPEDLLTKPEQSGSSHPDPVAPEEGLRSRPRPTTSTRPFQGSSRPAGFDAAPQGALPGRGSSLGPVVRLDFRALASSRSVQAVVAFAAAVVLVVAGWSAWPEAGISYRVTALDGEGAPSYEGSGSHLVATESLEAAVYFSDKSRLIVEPHTTLRLAVEERGRVVTRLSQGAVRVDVEHHEETDYRFRAGPYEVQVTGTEFSLSFDPKVMKMTLEMSEGSVIVRDPISGERTVRGGERLELPEQLELAEQVGQGTGGDIGRTLELSTLEEEMSGDDWSGDDQVLGDEVPSKRGSKAGSASVRANFLSLARQGKFEAIVAAAQREGVARCLSSRSGAELQELAQAARYTGRSALAVRVFEDLAQRHRGSSPGRNAPFFLGRIAEERGQSTKALSLYENYLAASPRGLYAAEALGRKMNLVHKSRGAAAARPIAAQYVERFPKGAYHSLARTLLKNTSR